MSKINVGYEAVEGTGIGIKSAEFILDHTAFTDSGATGSKEITKVIPPYSLRLGCLVETLEVFNSAVTIAIGITAAGNTWTSATTGTCTALAYKHFFPYGAQTIITGAEHTTAAGESVHITITETAGGGDYTLITTGKVKIKLFYLATQN